MEGRHLTEGGREACEDDLRQGSEDANQVQGLRHQLRFSGAPATDSTIFSQKLADSRGLGTLFPHGGGRGEEAGGDIVSNGRNT